MKGLKLPNLKVPELSSVNVLVGATRAGGGKKEAAEAPPAPPPTAIITEESAAATVFTFTPLCCVCLPSCRRLRVSVTPGAGVFRSEGLTCFASDAHESFAWQDVVLLRGVGGGRRGIVLLAFFLASAVVGAVAALSVKTSQEGTGVGVGGGVFLVLLGMWLLMRSSSLRALTQAAGEHVLAPSDAGHGVSPGELDKVLRACAAAWTAAHGSPSGAEADPTIMSASPTVGSRVASIPCGTSEELNARGGGLLVVQKMKGFLRLPLLTSVDTCAFYASSVRYTMLTTGNRTLNGLRFALLPIVLAVLFNRVPQMCNSTEAAPCTGPIAGAAVLGLLLLIRWFLSLKVELTMNLGDCAGLQPRVLLPSLTCAAAHKGVLAAMLGEPVEAAQEAQVSPLPTVNIVGRDGTGSHIELTVGPSLTSIKVTTGATSSLQKFLCQLCLASTEYTCRTSDILFASTSRTDLINTLLASLVMGAIVIAIAVIINSKVPLGDYFNYIIYAALGGAALNVLYGYLTRATTVTLGTVFSAPKPVALELFHHVLAVIGVPPPIFVYHLSITPLTNLLSSTPCDARTIQVRVLELAAAAKARARARALGSGSGSGSGSGGDAGSSSGKGKGSSKSSDSEGKAASRDDGAGGVGLTAPLADKEEESREVEEKGAKKKGAKAKGKEAKGGKDGSAAGEAVGAEAKGAAAPSGEPAPPPPASSPPTPPLPDGWEQKTSKSTGKVYFFNKSTNSTVWERPS